MCLRYSDTLLADSADLDGKSLQTLEELILEDQYGASSEWVLNYNKLNISKIYKVASKDECLAAVRRVKPGEAIVVASGGERRDWGTITIPETVKGSPDKKIYILPERMGDGCFVGETRFLIHSSHVVLSGHYFIDVNEGIRISGTQNEISHNLFLSTGKSAFLRGAKKPGLAIYVYKGAEETEICHNTFSDTHGVSLLVGQPEPQRWKAEPRYREEYRTPKLPRIHHNTFRDIPKVRENAGEAICLGYGWNYDSEDYDNSIEALIYSNLFERCIGDSEVISIKSDNNLIFHNLVRECGAARITIRQGMGNLLVHNFIRRAGGFRISGRCNWLSYNRVTTDSPKAVFLLHQGAENYHPAENNVIARNLVWGDSNGGSLIGLISARVGSNKLATGNRVYQNVLDGLTLGEPSTLRELQGAVCYNIETSHSRGREGLTMHDGVAFTDFISSEEHSFLISLEFARGFMKWTDAVLFDKPTEIR